jgi:ribosomal protein L11 methyltransferase
MNNDLSPQEWIALTVRVHPGMADVVANFCHEHDARGIVLDDEDPGLTAITAYFDMENWDQVHSDLKRYLARLSDLFTGVAAPVIEFTTLKQENWATAWKEYFQPVTIGRRIIVTPPWLEPEPEGREIVIIDPAEAFGTGTHETTQGCLELLEAALERARPAGGRPSVLDVGCGSGILAIAAAALGAGHVRAVDNDPVAIASAQHNAELNGLADRVAFECRDIPDLTEPADILTANLDTRTLIGHKDKLISLTLRYLIISGVPLDQWDDLKEALLTGELMLVEELTRVEWGCAMMERCGMPS